jgi:hypothetical protein
MHDATRRGDFTIYNHVRILVSCVVAGNAAVERRLGLA